MLYLGTISQKALGLLKRFMLDDHLSNFSLAGGTALALQLGHRISIDLDLFNQMEFDAEDLKMHLVSNYGFKISGVAKNTLSGFVEGVKIDFISHCYNMLDIPSLQNDLRLYSLKDIAAMKLNAVCNRGTRKDFADIYRLFDVFSLPQQLSFYKAKYGQEDLMMLFKSLLYFEDAELEPDPQYLDENVSWQNVKQTIADKVRKIEF